MLSSCILCLCLRPDMISYTAYKAVLNYYIQNTLYIVEVLKTNYLDQQELRTLLTFFWEYEHSSHSNYTRTGLLMAPLVPHIPTSPLTTYTTWPKVSGTQIYTVIMASISFRKAFHMILNVAPGICSHSATRALLGVQTKNGGASLLKLLMRRHTLTWGHKGMDMVSNYTQLSCGV